MDEIFSDAEVLSLAGMEALDWFQAIKEKRRPLPADFDWACLAKGAALRARITDEEESLAWRVWHCDFSGFGKEQPGVKP